MWIDGVLKEEYALIKVLKKTEEKSVIVYRQRTLNKNIVCIKCKNGALAYRALMKISAKNLPRIYDVQEDESGVTVLEEFIDGVSVSDILSTGLYDEKGARFVISELCDALFALHGVGIVYRDIKPENVMITSSGEVKLIDFDAAKIFRRGKSPDTVVMGTMGYAAPEQFGLAQSDGRTDIYALGVLMNVMLTGEHPSQKMYSGRLKRVIEKCIRANPDERYPDTASLKKSL